MGKDEAIVFHAQLGDRTRTQDALRVASSFFANGLEKFASGELEDALALFEQALAVNQKYLQSTASGNVLCYNNIAAVHDKLGNLNEAVNYYERARSSLSSPQVPKDEANFLGRRKRQELLKHVQQKLERIPRTHEPKVGAGVRLSEVQSLVVSIWAEGEAQLQTGNLQGALVSFEQVLGLNKRFAGAGVDGLLAVAETLSRLGLVHSRLNDLPRAEAHLGAAAALLRELPPDVDPELAAVQRERLAQLSKARDAVQVALDASPGPAAPAAEEHSVVAPVVSLESLQLDNLLGGVFSPGGSSVGGASTPRRGSSTGAPPLARDSSSKIDAAIDALPPSPAAAAAAAAAPQNGRAKLNGRAAGTVGFTSPVVGGGAGGHEVEGGCELATPSTASGPPGSAAGASSATAPLPGGSGAGVGAGATPSSSYSAAATPEAVGAELGLAAAQLHAASEAAAAAVGAALSSRVAARELCAAQREASDDDRAEAAAVASRIAAEGGDGGGRIGGGTGGGGGGGGSGGGDDDGAAPTGPRARKPSLDARLKAQASARAEAGRARTETPPTAAEGGAGGADGSGGEAAAAAAAAAAVAAAAVAAVAPAAAAAAAEAEESGGDGGGGAPEGASEPEVARTAAAPARVAAAEEEDEFAWRKDQEPDDGGGPIDDRVEGAAAPGQTAPRAARSQPPPLVAAPSRLWPCRCHRGASHIAPAPASAQAPSSRST